MIMYKAKENDLHFGNKKFSIGWGDINYLYDGCFHDEESQPTIKFDKRCLTKYILVDHPLVNWNDNIDSFF